MLVTPEQLQQALLALQPEDTKPLWPLEKVGVAHSRTEYLMPVLAILSVLDLPKLQQEQPEGGVVSYIAACIAALTHLVRPAAPQLTIDRTLHDTSSADNAYNRDRITSYRKAVAQKLVRACTVGVHLRMAPAALQLRVTGSAAAGIGTSGIDQGSQQQSQGAQVCLPRPRPPARGAAPGSLQCSP